MIKNNFVEIVMDYLYSNKYYNSLYHLESESGWNFYDCKKLNKMKKSIFYGKYDDFLV